MINTLYKYRPLTGDSFKYTQDIFLNNRLYLPTVSQLNDPNEGLFSLELEDPNNPWTKYANTRYISQIKDKRVFSLSEKNDNILMWSHYAANHTGICIEFDISNSSPIFNNLYKVSYSNSLPHIKRNNNENEIMIKGLLNKTSDWKYEAEWRLISTDTYGYLPITNEIKSVTVGARIASEDLDWVKYWIKNNSRISLKKCTFSNSEYKLDICEI